MDLTLNPKVDLSETSPLMLGGVDFRVAPLVFRQTSRIEPKLPDVLAILNRRAAALGGVRLDENGNAVFASAADGDAFLRALGLDEAESGLLLEIIHAGLTRVYPRLTLDDLVDLPLRAADLLNGVGVVLVASGLIEKKAPNAGEAPAASP